MMAADLDRLVSRLAVDKLREQDDVVPLLVKRFAELVRAENTVSAGQAADRYSWMTPPRRSRRRTVRRSIRSDFASPTAEPRPSAPSASSESSRAHAADNSSSVSVRRSALAWIARRFSGPTKLATFGPTPLNPDAPESREAAASSSTTPGATGFASTIGRNRTDTGPGEWPAIAFDQLSSGRSTAR